MKSPEHSLDADQRTLVLFDGACPLCSREIAHYQRRRGAEQIAWLDVSDPDADLTTLGITRQQALARFHVRDPGGEWQIGVSGFISLWSNLPAYMWLAKLVRILHLTAPLEVAYERFLVWRNSRSCNHDKCRIDSNQ